MAAERSGAGSGRATGGEPSAFRAAISKARTEAHDGRAESIDSGVPTRPSFEYRVERRRRSAKRDTVRWNGLGQKGWELVSLSRRQAVFKRLRRSAG